jgi:hypothetical protein
MTNFEISKERFAKASKISLIEFLKKEGIKIEETPSYFRCLSPLHNESVPSFDINKKTGRWVDRGTGKRGDIIEFIQIYKNISNKEAVDFLLGGERLELPTYEPVKRDRKSIEIVSVEALSTPHLWNYIAKRKISKKIANYYLKEVSFSFPFGKYPDKVYKAVGFESDSGGWELRSEFFKICTANKNVTTIRGLYANRINLFEGFFSFLSALEIDNQEIMDIRGSCVILNSLSFLPQMLSFWGEDTYLSVLLDNDTAGDKAVKLIDSSGIPYSDNRDYYFDYNDLNDLLMDKPLPKKKHGKLSELINSK